ncbi:MAG: hypothetical protein HYS45_02125 [Parcubacteria group bacterium]|nr:hypothetical protein [Parcubacteria group bacterium]
MRAFTYIRMHVKKIAALGVLAAVLFFLVREANIAGNKLPLEVRQLVRNLSAKETEWQLATAAQPGDALEHFVLIRLSADNPDAIRGIRVAAQTNALDAYREGSFSSRALGVTGDALFTKQGVAVPELLPGEFLDFSWQTSITENTSFANGEAPLLESAVTVSANGFSELKSRSAVSLYSTLERSSVSIAKEPYVAPKAYSMNPRRAYEDLGTGVLIAGEDLAGIARLAVLQTGRNMAWRLVSNDLLEAGIPAGLDAGTYTVGLYDKAGKQVSGTLSFEVFPSKNRAIVVASTPSVVRSGQKRTIVLQGIHLDENLQLLLSKAGSGQVHALESLSRINERVLTAEIPAAISSGTYTILVGDDEQEAHITVN